jgi:hypothetical protein
MLGTSASVMRGLDPRIHQSAKSPFEKDGLPVKPDGFLFQ